MEKPKTIAYLRVSTTDQDLEKNRFDILKLANEKGLGQVQFIPFKSDKGDKLVCAYLKTPKGDKAFKDGSFWYNL